MIRCRLKNAIPSYKYFIVLIFLSFYLFYTSKHARTLESTTLAYNAQQTTVASPGQTSGPAVNSAPEPKTFWPYDTPAKIKNVTILMWTKYYGNLDLVTHIIDESPIPDWCNVTFDKKELNNSGAIVFHVVGNDFKPLDVPSRNASQLWVYYALESPANVQTYPEDVDDIFNRTMTYRLDSDYPCPYGYVTKRQVPLPENPYYSDKNFPCTKSKLIAWMVSHCSTMSSRAKLVDQMIENGIEIDIYGSCGKLQCDVNQEVGCYEKLGKTYKFYLSFENSICKDYVTEKFSNALHANMVPIVFGGGDYESILPPYPKPGFINVRDFRSAKELAKFLKYLDKNETAYGEYFEWKRYYEINIRQGFGGFKKICYDLQNQNYLKSTVYRYMHKWWSQDAKCNVQPLPWQNETLFKFTRSSK